MTRSGAAAAPAGAANSNSALTTLATAAVAPSAPVAGSDNKKQDLINGRRYDLRRVDLECDPDERETMGGMIDEEKYKHPDFMVLDNPEQEKARAIAERAAGLAADAAAVEEEEEEEDEAEAEAEADAEEAEAEAAEEGEAASGVRASSSACATCAALSTMMLHSHCKK